MIRSSRPLTEVNRSFPGFFNFWRKKVTKFESDLMETNEDIALQSQGILQTVAFVWLEERGGGGGGGEFERHATQTSVKFRDFGERYLRSLQTYFFKTWQVY